MVLLPGVQHLLARTITRVRDVGSLACRAPIAVAPVLDAKLAEFPIRYATAARRLAGRVRRFGERGITVTPAIGFRFRCPLEIRRWVGDHSHIMWQFENNKLPLFGKACITDATSRRTNPLLVSAGRRLRRPRHAACHEDAAIAAPRVARR